MKKILEKLAGTYPSPLKKHDVPLWVYIASDISMCFHGEHHFAAYPYVVRTGGVLEAQDICYVTCNISLDNA